MLVFATISPHPPILLPSVGLPKDRAQVKNTIEALEKLGGKLKKINPEKIIISAPHPDWGIKVPLHFLISKSKEHCLENESFLETGKSKIFRFHPDDVGTKSGQFKIQNYQNPGNPIIEPNAICPILTTLDSPKQHFEWGKQFFKLKIVNCKLKIALIASGDLSHCLRADGPYGFHPDGPKYDKALIEALKKKDLETILKLDNIYPDAAECGLRSFCFLLGILEALGLDWQPEILSYEGPFGVGYLVVNFQLNRKILPRSLV